MNHTKHTAGLVRIMADIEALDAADLAAEKAQARATLKAINRHVRKERIFEGGRTFGVDWPTWCMCYPQLAMTFQRLAEFVTGRKGCFMPAHFSARGGR